MSDKSESEKSASEKSKPGKILWTDLTVEDAESVKQFYKKVIGWTSSPVSMGDYNDYNMTVEGEAEPTAGICHAKGGNANIPPVWMVYISVDNLSESLSQCESMGGKVLKRPEGEGKYAIIEDPAGAVCTLYQDN
ncbi:VOC family protein [Pleionea mediterranea]|uniref:VOC domain-containing protein n=1 Tax=Pleionea mediterranea TaxID=523701 RepID=A0A316FJC1_9GAMM|nr:VOC family protein [Pleionea mediterranea]PWK48599.1 hypothetical protein C8D97_109150 [Pleionea mediterranea]